MAEVWAPTLADVGGCIPTRTVNTTVPGDDEYLGTFTPQTEPTNTQVQLIIDHAVSDVLSMVPTVTPALEDLAKNAAMWRAAADTELAHPNRNADANYYGVLNERALYAWKLLLESAGDQSATPDSKNVPVWHMPPPVLWGDWNGF